MRADRLRSLRIKKKITQGEAAKRMGIVRSTYSNYEAGNREPDHETLKKFADYFEVSTDYLLGNDDINKEAVKNIIEAYDLLSESKQKIVLDLIESLLQDETRGKDKR